MQVVQEVRSGATRVREIPDPIAPPGGVVIATAASLISAGTERAVVELARKSLLAKARERPDHVRRVLQKLRQEGLVATARQVQAKLDEPMPLGYSAAGVVLEVGRGVTELAPGDRVAAAAPHAGVVAAGKNLCARVPDGVSFEQAAYAGVGAIALQGVRLARVSLGERVLVIGLGLIGQIAVMLLLAQGCRVLGTDLDPAKLEIARSLGAEVVAPGAALEAIPAFTDGLGVDAAVITASTDSNGPIELSAEACRPKGRIVLVGVAGLNLPRPPFFKKELEFTVSASLGAGRWDPVYEEKGVDYPVGHARWTVQRNLRAVLETIAAGRLPVERLTTHRFSIERAEAAYDLVTSGRERLLGVVLEYPAPPPTRRRRVDLPARAGRGRGGDLGISVIGAGNFARLVMMPALSALGGFRLRGLCSAKGLNAVHSGGALGFAFAASDAAAIWDDRETDAVFVATRHDLHAELVIAALRAGKHVFVEKPLCIRSDELAAIRASVEELGPRCPVLMVGYNRRFARATAALRDHFAGVAPISVSHRFATAALPAGSWPHDEDIGGGRLLGEACHAIDTCTAIVGTPPVRVQAESVDKVGGIEAIDDRVAIAMRHACGGLSIVHYQAGGDRAGPKERIEVFGGGRTGIADDWDTVELWRDSRVTRVRAGKDKGHAAELERFVAACRRGGEWPIPWSHVEGVAWATLAALRSLREGRAIAAGEDAPE